MNSSNHCGHKRGEEDMIDEKHWVVYVLSSMRYRKENSTTSSL